jgi:NADPH:quinone reductase-like Zn-dependent oxidoreductase
MHAAVVRSFDQPPRYEELPVPTANGDEKLVEVLAAGLHPRVRSGANGSHYTSDGELPLTPGIDAVGRLPDGEVAYFITADDAPGTMAEQALLDPRRCVPLPDGVDVAAIAAGMNPGMSSWVGLRRRAALEPGQSVLVLGATGNAGQLAIQIAKHLGAGEVIGAGRDRGRLAELKDLGADAVVSLEDREDSIEALGEFASEVDVVIDYLWGKPSEQAIPAIVRRRRERSRPLKWVQIGAVAGADISLSSAALRAANLQILGSGQGSVTATGIVAELPALAREIDAGTFAVKAKPIPLSDVEESWNAPVEAGRRIVFVPAMET